MPYKNPEDKKAKDKAYYKANSEKIKARSRAYREANLEKIKVRVKVYYKANPEKYYVQHKAYRKANPEKAKAHSRAWARKNKGAINSFTRAYQTLKQNKNCITTKEDKQLARWVYSQSKNLSETTDIKWHVDHIKPLSKGGMHSLNNLQIVPATWNLQKKNNNEERWNG